jgi:hypothetical protein
VSVRLAIRVLLVLALPGVVFGFLTSVPPVVFDYQFDFFAVEVGWVDVAGALITAASVVAVAAVLVKVGIGAERYPTRRER